MEQETQMLYRVKSPNLGYYSYFNEPISADQLAKAYSRHAGVEIKVEYVRIVVVEVVETLPGVGA